MHTRGAPRPSPASGRRGPAVTACLSCGGTKVPASRVTGAAFSTHSLCQVPQS